MQAETKEISESTTGLVEVDKVTVLAAFSGKDGLESVIEETKLLIEIFDHDMSTGASRKRTASLANKVSKLKVNLDGMGKDLVSGWKTQAKAVDVNRKIMRDSLDELKVVARKPLTDWEAEQAAIEAARLANEAAEKLAIEVAKDEELAVLMDANFDREAQEAIDLKIWNDEQDAKEEAARQEAKVKLEAERLAKAAIDKIEADKQKAIQAEIDATAKAEQAERDKLAEQEARKLEARNAEKARIAAIDTAKKQREQAVEDARLAEVKRQEDEADRVEAERVAREKDRKNAGEARKRVKEQLMKFAEIDEETARRVVLAVKKIDELNITY